MLPEARNRLAPREGQKENTKKGRGSRFASITTINVGAHNQGDFTELGNVKSWKYASKEADRGVR